MEEFVQELLEKSGAFASAGLLALILWWRKERDGLTNYTDRKVGETDFAARQAVNAEFARMRQDVERNREEIEATRGVMYSAAAQLARIEERTSSLDHRIGDIFDLLRRLEGRIERRHDEDAGRRKP